MKVSKLLYFFACFLFVFGILTVQGQKTDLSVKGTVEQIVIEENPVRYEYILASESGNRYRLSDSKSFVNYANRRVSLAGTLDGNRLIVQGDVRVLDENGTMPTPPPTFGSRKVLVLHVTFPGTVSPDINFEGVRNNIFTGAKSVNQFVKEASLNRYHLTGVHRPDGDISDWLTIPFSSDSCDTYGQWTQAADTQARQHGYEPNNYNTIIYAMQRTCHPDSGNWGILGNTSGVVRIWTNPNVVLFNAEVLTHELGHNLGLLHANALRCSGPVFPFNCVEYEYGDDYDPMGRGIRWFFNNNFRLSLGWLTGRAPEITESGVYRLEAPSAPSKGNQVLRIPLKFSDGTLTGYSYFLEYRRPFSYDNQLFPFFEPLFNGIGIRYSTTGLFGYATRLVDITPDTPISADAPLTVGNTYTDATHGVTITTLSANPQFGARVRIQLSH